MVELTRVFDEDVRSLIIVEGGSVHTQVHIWLTSQPKTLEASVMCQKCPSLYVRSELYECDQVIDREKDQKLTLALDVLWR
jgi:hypothetical protein